MAKNKNNKNNTYNAEFANEVAGNVTNVNADETTTTTKTGNKNK